MKKIAILFILTLCLILTTSHAQNPMVHNLLNDVRIDSLKRFVRGLSGEIPVSINGQLNVIQSRFYLSPGNEKAFQYMKSEFRRYGYTIDSMVFSSQGKNLFAIKPGYKYPNRRFMLGAHYDNLPDSINAPGADDNASGTSTVLEAARVFRNYNFPYTVVFALWDEEEPGLIGSSAYAATVGNQNEILMGYINVDMLGWDGNNDSIADLHTRPVANSLSLSGKAQQCNSVYNIGLGLHIINPGSGNTDHAPFWNNNLTAIGIDEEYDNDFNPYWHTLADSVGQFNLPFYLKCSKLAYATLADCASDTVNTVGIGEYSFDNSISVFPNPFLSNLTVKSTQTGNELKRVVISDMFGKIIYDEVYNAPIAQLNISSLSSGAYLIQAFTDKSIYSRKLLKQ